MEKEHCYCRFVEMSLWEKGMDVYQCCRCSEQVYKKRDHEVDKTRMDMIKEFNNIDRPNF